MPTPNSPANSIFDIHADPAFAAQFDTKTGESTLGMAKFREPMGSPRGLNCNVGRTEQVVRLTVGAALVTAAAVAPLNRGWRIAMAAAGATQLVTGSTRFCPLWQALGVSTCSDGEMSRF